jgi:hypothetical protein
MSVGQTPENIAILFLLAFAAVPAFFVMVLLGRLLQWIFRIRSSAFAPLFTVIAVVGAVLGASLYLDLRGETLTGSVVAKNEEIEYREEGDWRFQRRLTVQYTLPGQSPATATLSPPVAQFDALVVGDEIALRVLNLGEWPSLVRLADQSTLTWLPWPWIGGALGVILVGIVLWKLSNTRVGCLPGVLFVCLLATVPFVQKYREWQQSLDPSLTPLRVSTTVEAVQRVTWLDPLPGEGNDGDEWETGFTVPQPYDIVTVRFRPEGYVDLVLGVDAVDAGKPAVRPGQPVIVEYGLDDPRRVRLLDASRMHYWTNPLGWVQDQIVNLTLAFVLSLALSWVGTRLRQWWTRRIEQAAPYLPPPLSQKE